MFTETEHLRVQDSYTVEEITGILLLIAIKQNFIKRQNLTDKGKRLVTEAEKYESRYDCH